MSAAIIHSTAIVAKGAKLGKGVEVGPFCTIGPQVVIGAGTKLISHVVIAGATTLGRDNIVYPFASLGQPSPDRKFKGEPTTLMIGDGNDIREGVTMHVGTAADKSETLVGSHNLFMAGSHVAHDCVVGSHCILANYVQLAGHVEVADHVTIGGLSGVLQRIRIGAHAIVGGHTAVDHDVPPYANVSGARASLRGLNLVGLRRRGFEKDLIHVLDEAYAFLFGADDTQSMQERAKKLKRRSKQPEVKQLADFVLESQRGMTSYAEGEA
jgi:UDP-N-acetylglucosamine acyltransferase